MRPDGSSVLMLSVAVAVALLASSCSGDRSLYLYDVSATTACLKALPEYVRGRPPSHLARGHDQLFLWPAQRFTTPADLRGLLFGPLDRIPEPFREQMRRVAVQIPAGGSWLTVYINGTDETWFGDVQMYFFPSVLTERRFIRGVLRGNQISRGTLEGSLQALLRRQPDTLTESKRAPHRNVAVLWSPSGLPAHWRQSLYGCLSTHA
jgi:hypothetical protein